MRFAYALICVYAAAMTGLGVWATFHRPDVRVRDCVSFACLEHAQVSHGIDNAYKSKFAGRTVDCAAKTWEQGPVVVCRFSG